MAKVLFKYAKIGPGTLKLSLNQCSYPIPVHAQKKLVHVPSFAQAIALCCLELHVLSMACVSKIQSLMLLEHVKCLI